MRSIVCFLDRLSDLGAGAEDSDDERLRHGTLIFASMVITLISLIWVATYFAYGYPISAAVPAWYQLVTVVGLVVLARTRRFGVFRTTQLLAFLVLPALLQASLGGFVASSAMILWAIFAPLAALALEGLRRSVVWLVAFFAELVVLGLLDPRLSQDPAALPRGLVIMRRSRQSATPTWWRAGCQSHVRTTLRRSPAWRWRCGTRSPRSPSYARRSNDQGLVAAGLV